MTAPAPSTISLPLAGISHMILRAQTLADRLNDPRIIAAGPLAFALYDEFTTLCAYIVLREGDAFLVDNVSLGENFHCIMPNGEPL